MVIIPTYNERDNIGELIDLIFKLNVTLDILVVDDNSPDGTAQVVRFKQNEYPHKVYLLERLHKQGLGKAYISGFLWGLERHYEALIEMDADFSHRPQDLEKIINTLEKYDFVIGSRYVPQGLVLNWGWLRKFISRFGSFYARMILGFPILDWTGGFNGWKSYVLEQINLGEILSEGYAFQIELKYKALCLGFKGIEIPIVFEDRRVGQSKMSFQVILEALIQVWRMKWWKK